MTAPPGCRTVPALITPAERRVLREEARAVHGSAEQRRRDDFQLVDGWQLLGPVRNSVASAGDAHAAVHRRMVDRFAGLVRPGLGPTLSCYLYYDTGDFVGLHLDQERCHYDVLVVLDGEPGPLCVHPELARTPPQRLAVMAAAGIPEPGSPASLRAGPLVLAGRATPHHRPAHRGPATLTIAAFCFGPLSDGRPTSG
ncbi:MAG: hypothetical protein ABW022_09015 [Actinoplanes sp.]